MDKRSKSNFVSLLRTINKDGISLFLGAGVSASCGIPTWKELINQICSCFFYHWEFDSKKYEDNVPKNMSIAFWEEFFFSEEASKNADELSNEDPIRVAELLKSCIRPNDWIYLLNKLLYHRNDIIESDLLKSLADLVAEKSIHRIITTNYDDLLELYLKSRGLKVKSIAFETIPNQNEKSVIHVHGILPKLGGKKSKIVFTESEYHEEFSKPNSWTNLVQLNCFSTDTCLFIGSSFSDINVNKLLRISRDQTKQMHYAFIFEEIKRNEKINMLFLNYLNDLGIKPIIVPRKSDKDFNELPNLITILVDFLKNEEHELRRYAT